MGNVDAKEKDDFLKQIEEKNTRYLDSYISRKFERIAEMYTKDCRFMPAGFPIQKGREGIADFWAKVVDLGFHKLTFVTQETIGPVSKMFACERCEYWFEDKNGTELQRGKYIVVWKKEKDEWRYHFDIWNPDHLELIKTTQQVTKG